MIPNSDTIRMAVSAQMDCSRKALWGQFLTPSSIASFMASLFSRTGMQECRLLDAGAGIGSLTEAFLERWASGGFGFSKTRVDVFEIDQSMHPYLKQMFDGYENRLDVVPAIHGKDFVAAAVQSLSGDLFAEPLPRYTHAILNPPYKKIRSDSIYRSALRKIGVETVNLYSGFVALALALLEDHGQLVAIIPRSFCNGPYYRPFREFILDRSALRHMHLFETRDRAFRDDGVLQETIIVLLERGVPQGPVTVSQSTDDSFTDYGFQEYPFSSVVRGNDPERFVRVPNHRHDNTIDLSPRIQFSLEDLGIEVSTGPVVDFRLRDHIRRMPEAGTVPLLYPGHFSGDTLVWPKKEFRKANAIVRNTQTEKWLFPAGYYTVVRRFSSKEERRRIVANVVDASVFSGFSSLGFENHLNVFHQRRQGLPEDLARGLSVFLNATDLDNHFRCFNGHTQVNATDLRQIKYPAYRTLIQLGKWAKKQLRLEQSMIDAKVRALAA